MIQVIHLCFLSMQFQALLDRESSCPEGQHSCTIGFLRTKALTWQHWIPYADGPEDENNNNNKNQNGSSGKNSGHGLYKKLKFIVNNVSREGFGWILGDSLDCFLFISCLKK